MVPVDPLLDELTAISVLPCDEFQKTTCSSAPTIANDSIASSLIDVEAKAEVSIVSTGLITESVDSCSSVAQYQQCGDFPTVTEAAEPPLSRQHSPGIEAGLIQPAAEASRAVAKESQKKVVSKEVSRGSKMHTKTGSPSSSEKVAKPAKVAQAKVRPKGHAKRSGADQTSPNFSDAGSNSADLDSQEEELAQEDMAAKKKRKQIQLQFHQAVKDGNFTKLRLLMKDKADVNVKLPEIGRTPIHDACMEKHQKIVKYLLNEKADINIKSDNKGYTPLHVCVSKAKKGHGDALESLQRFMDARADAKIVNHAGITPLQMAQEANLPEIVAALSDYGAG